MTGGITTFLEDPCPAPDMIRFLEFLCIRQARYLTSLFAIDSFAVVESGSSDFQVYDGFYKGGWYVDPIPHYVHNSDIRTCRSNCIAHPQCVGIMFKSNHDMMCWRFDLYLLVSEIIYQYLIIVQEV